MPVSLHIDNVTKRFENTLALDNVTLHIGPGELFFLLGPSGCGKTTLLRAIAGFNQPDAGSIKIGDRDVTRLPPHLRDTGM
ncbi:MAG: ATP-binding cassette domain-containing protein, partial [Kiritimatiellaeota bacterium]|nr:ATP-binding cassette domain-containing protein [Kiritimatiellota bacterium]